MKIRLDGLLVLSLMASACDAPVGGTHSGESGFAGAYVAMGGAMVATGGGPVVATGGAGNGVPAAFGGSTGAPGPIPLTGGSSATNGSTVVESGNAGGNAGSSSTSTLGGAMSSGSAAGGVMSRGGATASAGSPGTAPASGGSTMPTGGTAGGPSNRGGASGTTVATGGSATGGSATGGSATGGSATGGSATGGSAGQAGSPGAAVAHFFLPTGEPDNTAAPTIEVDANAGIHAVYPAYAGGDAYYAYCGPNCAGSNDVKVVKFPTDATVANVMLALTRDGHPRVLMSSFTKVYYGSCDSNCTNPDSWVVSPILDHQGDREVTGEALALDPNGRPRFLMHTYRAYLGIGQKTPETYYVSCDSHCESAANWSSSLVAETIWEGTHLRIDAAGTARVATTVRLTEGEKAGQKLTAYLECSTNCNTEAGWNGIGFVAPYESDVEAVRIQPTVALALTATGAPRVAVLGKNNDGEKNIIYFECDADCTNDHWLGAVVSNHAKISTGLDLALDAQGRPRLVYALNYNIGLAYCDQTPCGGPNSNWDLTKVELGSDMPPDQIFLWDNCTVAAWFLHSPSIALTRDGKPRVGYQARDISGGFQQPDPTKPRCVAGTDMTWSRVAVMPAYK